MERRRECVVEQQLRKVSLRKETDNAFLFNSEVWRPQARPVRECLHWPFCAL